MGNTILMRQRGTITLPIELRQKYDFDEGTAFTIVDLGGTIILIPRATIVPQLTAEIEKIREEAGVSLEELFAGLREEREQYYQEKYGDV